MTPLQVEPVAYRAGQRTEQRRNEVAMRRDDCAVGSGWAEIVDGVLAWRCVELNQTLGLVVGGEGCLVIHTGRDEVHGAELAAAIRTVMASPGQP